MRGKKPLVYHIPDKRYTEFIQRPLAIQQQENKQLKIWEDTTPKKKYTLQIRMEKDAHISCIGNMCIKYTLNIVLTSDHQLSF